MNLINGFGERGHHTPPNSPFNVTGRFYATDKLSV